MNEELIHQKILFGYEYNPNKENNYTKDFVDNLESKLEPKRNKLEQEINQLINNCIKENNLQQIVLKYNNEVQEVRFIVDLDIIKV